MIYNRKVTKTQINELLDAMKCGDEIEIKPICQWRNSKAIKTDMFIVTTRDVYTMEMMKEILK